MSTVTRLYEVVKDFSEYAFVSAGAVVSKDVKSYALMAEVSARQIGWMTQFGEQIQLPLQCDG